MNREKVLIAFVEAIIIVSVLLLTLSIGIHIGRQLAYDQINLVKPANSI